jgi:hypothetical protein
MKMILRIVYSHSSDYSHCSESWSLSWPMSGSWSQSWVESWSQSHSEFWLQSMSWSLYL